VAQQMRARYPQADLVILADLVKVTRERRLRGALSVEAETAGRESGSV
jgi:hypothetical protein